MSHVIEVDLEIRSLDALDLAAQACGLVFVAGQKTYRWYGKHVGDYPLPKGFAKEDMGKCDHALSVKGSASAYEIGVCKRRDGKPGYTLLFDFYSGGFGLMRKISETGQSTGHDCLRLANHYGAQVTAARMKRQGYHVSITEQAGKNLAGQPITEVVALCTK